MVHVVRSFADSADIVNIWLLAGRLLNVLNARRFFLLLELWLLLILDQHVDHLITTRGHGGALM